MKIFKSFLAKRDAKKLKFIRKKLIDYYTTIEEFQIPPEILADFDIELIVKRGTVDFWYGYLVK